MSTWSYRIIKYRSGSGYGLHEVHFDDGGKPLAMTTDPVGFSCDADEGPGGVRNSLALALADAVKRDVLDEPAEWRGL